MSSKKEIQQKTEIEKNQFLDQFKHLYNDDTMLKLYETEIDNYDKYINQKVDEAMGLYTAKRNAIKAQLDEIDQYVSTKKSKKESSDDDYKKQIRDKILNNLTYKDYELIYVKTIQYIKANIYHGYDSMYYVLNKNKDGHILPLEYTDATFKSTFQKYFPENISKWFNKYHMKYVLCIDNTKQRSYTDDETNYLNLFSGYKFNRFDKRDEARINKGMDGVKYILNHIKGTWNSGNQQCYEYDHKWICKLVYGFKLKTMIYLRGKMGRGKTQIVKFIMRVLGLHTTIVLSNDSTIMGDFNGPLMGKSLCCLDEIVNDFDSFKSLYNKLKPYITDDIMEYRNLYEKLKRLQNMTSWIMTGNYDMLKLDDPAKGDDRRLKVNDISNEVKDREYCDLLDKYCEDDDVIYAFFWYCIDNYDKDFNELQELKLLPVSESKKAMIAQSLDTCTMFLKACVNADWIKESQMIKPKELYNMYCDHMKKHEEKKQCMNNHTFLSKIKDYNNFITLHEGIRLKGVSSSPTNYVQIDRSKMIAYFKEKYFWTEYDDIDDDVESDQEEITIDKLLKENLELKKEIELLKQKLLIKQPISDYDYEDNEDNSYLEQFDFKQIFNIKSPNNTFNMYFGPIEKTNEVEEVDEKPKKVNKKEVDKLRKRQVEQNDQKLINHDEVEKMRKKIASECTLPIGKLLGKF